MPAKFQRLARPFEPGAWWVPVPAALLLIPFLNYAKSNSYPILSTEIALLAAALLALGLLLGAIGRIHRVSGALVVAGALTLLIDVQTRVFFDLSLHQYVWIPVGLFLVLLLLPKPAETAFLVLVFAMLAGILATPRDAPFAVSRSGGADAVGGPGASVADAYWIHLIVDEHIGIESIPDEFDPEHRLALRLRHDYVEDGFTIFGRAFTRFSQTHLSLPNIFNFSEEHPASLLTSGAGRFNLEESRYLARLHERGFRVRVFDSDYLGLCSAAGDTWNLACYRYSGNTIWGIHGTALSPTDRAVVIARMYVRLSKIYAEAASRISADPHSSQSVAPLVGKKVIAEFEQALLGAEPGSAWIVHVMLPHGPYALDANCKMRPWPWLDSGDGSDVGIWNTDGERDLRYPYYLEQLTCTHQVLQELFDSLRRAGIYDKANIVVHGDHGSRIATYNLRARPAYAPDFVPPGESLMDYQGTLFAFKPAGRPVGSYRHEMASVANLLDATSSGHLADGIADETDPYMYLVEWDASCTHDAPKGTPGCRLLKVPMPTFSNGAVASQAAARR